MKCAMKHFSVTKELHEKVAAHIDKKEVKVWMTSWVEKACNDLIKKEDKERK